MTIAVGSNDCLSGLKRQNNSLQSPSRASSNGGGAGARRKEVQTDGKLYTRWRKSGARGEIIRNFAP